jgi:hypothetical protein
MDQEPGVSDERGREEAATTEPDPVKLFHLYVAEQVRPRAHTPFEVTTI